MCMEAAINEMSARHAYMTEQRQFDSRLNIDESHLAHYNYVYFDKYMSLLVAKLNNSIFCKFLIFNIKTYFNAFNIYIYTKR